MKLAIATPTYNEAGNINTLLNSISTNLKDYPKLHYTVFVIDDHSPDGTAIIAEEWNEKYGSEAGSVKVIRRTKKEGLGKAYVDGFQQILSQDFDFILQMDADLSHDPSYIPRFLDAASSADFIVGSRYVAGGATPDWSWTRKVLSRGGNLYTRFFLGSTILDYTGGFNMYSSSLLKKLGLDSLQASGYGFLIELKYRALNSAECTTQIPIIFMDRLYGTSKIPRSTIISNLKLVPMLRFKKNI